MKQYPPLILLFALMLVFSASVSHAQRVGSSAPAFRLADIQGQPLALTDVLGKPLVLNIWATWCPPCREELPLFERAQTALVDDVTFLLVNNNENADVAAQFLAQEGISLLAAFEPTRAQRNSFDLDTTRDVVRDYRVRGMPTTFFIDADGIIQAVRVGMVSRSELTELLATIGVTWSPDTTTDTITEDVTEDVTESARAVTSLQPETTILGELHGRISSHNSPLSQLECGSHCPVRDGEEQP